jgi:hypothetical protein
MAAAAAATTAAARMMMTTTTIIRRIWWRTHNFQPTRKKKKKKTREREIDTERERERERKREKERERETFCCLSAPLPARAGVIKLFTAAEKTVVATTAPPRLLLENVTVSRS